MGHNDNLAVAKHMLQLPSDIIHRCLITCHTVLMVMYALNIQMTGYHDTESSELCGEDLT